MMKRKALIWAGALMLAIAPAIIPAPARPAEARVFIFSNASRDLEEFRAFAKLAGSLKPYGRVQIDIGALTDKTWHEVVKGSPWHEYASYSSTPAKFFPHPKIAPHFPADWVERNRALLLAKASVLRELGLEAAFSGKETHFLPESFFQQHPHLRGPRVDHPRRSTREEFAWCVDLDETRETIEWMTAELKRHVPEIKTILTKTNDAGAGLCWAAALYSGPNGPESCRHRGAGVRVRDLMEAVHQGARKGGGDVDIQIYGSNFWQNEEDVVAPLLPPKTYLDTRDASQMSVGSLINEAYPIKGLIDPLEILEDMERYDDPNTRTVFLRFTSMYARADEQVAAIAEPGDILQLTPGYYEDFELVRDGEPGKPIVIRGDLSHDIRSVFDSVSLRNRKHVILEKVTVNGTVDMLGAEDAAVRHCAVNAKFGIVANQPPGCRNCYIADNVVSYVMPWVAEGMGSGSVWGGAANVGEGIQITGPGNVICFNRVRGYRDGISLMEDQWAHNQISIDIYNNDIYVGADDAIEADFCMGNCRILRNRITNCFMGLSSQPSLGGPAYFIRNVMYNLIEAPFKLERRSVGNIFFHNTAVKVGDGLRIPHGPHEYSHTLLRNNLCIGGLGGGQYGRYPNGAGLAIYTPETDPTNDFDYDGVGVQIWDDAIRRRIERSAMLLGRTLDEMRLYDVLCAVNYAASQPSFDGRELTVAGKGVSGALGAYAALLDQRITRVILHSPPLTHQTGPIFLNILRYTDLPQTLACLAPRELVFLGHEINAFDYTRSVYRLYQAEGRFKRGYTVSQVLNRKEVPQ